MTSTPLAQRPVSVLVTGFEPFAGAAVNPSWEVAQSIAARWDGVRAVLLPVTFAGVRPALAAAITELRPDVVLSLGLAAGRQRVEVERVAVNLAHARIPDNDGAQPLEAELVPGGPAAYWATLPVAAVLAATGSTSVPVRVPVPVRDSLSAGAFVCNAAMYHLLDLTAGTPVRAGFVHVPATGADSVADHDPVATEIALLDLGDVTESVEAVLRAVLAAGGSAAGGGAAGGAAGGDAAGGAAGDAAGGATVRI